MRAIVCGVVVALLGLDGVSRAQPGQTPVAPAPGPESTPQPPPPDRPQVGGGEPRVGKKRATRYVVASVDIMIASGSYVWPSPKIAAGVFAIDVDLRRHRGSGWWRFHGAVGESSHFYGLLSGQGESSRLTSDPQTLYGRAGAGILTRGCIARTLCGTAGANGDLGFGSAVDKDGTGHFFVQVELGPELAVELAIGPAVVRLMLRVSAGLFSSGSVFLGGGEGIGAGARF